VNICGSVNKHTFPTGFGPGVTAVFHRILNARYALDYPAMQSSFCFTALLKKIVILTVVNCSVKTKFHGRHCMYSCMPICFLYLILLFHFSICTYMKENPHIYYVKCLLFAT